MQTDPQDLPALVKEVRRQLSLSQEGLARELGISFATGMKQNQKWMISFRL